MRILLAEDERKTAEFVRKGLTEQGFQVEVTGDGHQAVHLARWSRFDLLVLDVMLPGIDGWQVLAALRQAGDSVPVLFLTARDSVDDRVRGLELGADDYLVKPFAFSELVARIQSVLRRGPARQSDVLSVGDLEVDVARHRASRAGIRLPLTPKEFALLACLIRRTGQVLSRARIADEVWDINFDSDTNVVDVAVRRLRTKVDDPFPTKLIHTIRGMGYVLELR